MATEFETSPRPSRSGWLSRLGGGSTLTREEIERDAAAQLGVPVGEQHEHEVDQVDADAPSVDETPPARSTERRPGRLSGWVRDLVSPEPPDVRRQRIEAEAAAELERLSGRPEHPAA